LHAFDNLCAFLFNRAWNPHVSNIRLNRIFGTQVRLSSEWGAYRADYLSNQSVTEHDHMIEAQWIERRP
jgi:hypothetical protein